MAEDSQIQDDQTPDSSAQSWHGMARRVVSALTIDTTPLRISHDYRLLFTGQFVSAFGSAISHVVLPWQMYQLAKADYSQSQAAFLVGMLGVAEFVPMRVLAFVGGALADYVDRRRMILLTETGLALCCGALVVNALLPQPRIAALFVIAALFAACNALHRPALDALTPRIVPAELMTAVGALNSFRSSFTFIVGTSLAGVITSRFGAAAGYALAGCTFLISLVALLLMRAVPPPEGAQRPSLSGIADGLRSARSRQELLGTYLIDLNAMFFGRPMALFPAIAESFGPNTVGLLYAMPAVGSLVVTLTSGWTERINRHGLAVTLAAAVWGAAIVGFGLARNLWLALFFLAVAYGADTVSGIFRMTIWNQTIPDRLRGRLASIEMISYLTGPYLGNAEAGLVASLIGLRGSVVSGGVLCVIGSGALALLLPRFISYDGRAGLAGRQAEEAALLKSDERKGAHRTGAEAFDFDRHGEESEV